MSSLSLALYDLRRVAQRAECAAVVLMMGLPDDTPSSSRSALEDHRTEVLGELLDAIDRIDPGLGSRLLVAMYPGSVFSDQDQEATA